MVLVYLIWIMLPDIYFALIWHHFRHPAIVNFYSSRKPFWDMISLVLKMGKLRYKECKKFCSVAERESERPQWLLDFTAEPLRCSASRCVVIWWVVPFILTLFNSFSLSYCSLSILNSFSEICWFWKALWLETAGLVHMSFSSSQDLLSWLVKNTFL